MPKINTVRENTHTVDTKFLSDVIKRNNFVNLDEAFNNQIDAEIEKVKNNRSITDTQAKDLIEQWHKKKMLFNKEFDIQKLHISIDNNQALYIESQYHYESRKTITKQEPFNNQPLEEALENIWDKPAQNEFREDSVNWTRRGSGKKEGCSTCGRTGVVYCDKCNGQKLIAVDCPNCKGKGFIFVPDITVGKAAGKVGAAITSRPEQCLRCQASGHIKVTCYKCKGRGLLVCGTCQGKTELYKYEQIEADISVLSNNILLVPYQTIKDDWITKSKTNSQISYKDIISGQNEEKLKPLKTAGDGKYLLERYTVKVVPVARVSFQYKGREREIFIIDNEIKATETAYLLDKKKTGILIGIVTVSLIVLGIFGYNWSQNYKKQKVAETNQNSIALAQCVIEQATSNNIIEAKKCLDQIEVNSTDLTKTTQDSINKAIFIFLSKSSLLYFATLPNRRNLFASFENNEFWQVQYVKDKYYGLKYLPESTKEIIDDLIISKSILDNYDQITKLVNSKPDNDYETIKKWENLLTTEISTLDLFNSLHVADYKKGLNQDGFVTRINSHVVQYYTALMNNYLVYGSRENEFSTFLSKLEKLKSLNGSFDFTQIEVEINKALEKHKERWN